MTDTTTAEHATLLCQIDAELRLKGSNLTRWCQAQGIDPGYMRNALRGYRRGEGAQHNIRRLSEQLQLDLSPLIARAASVVRPRRSLSGRQPMAARLQEEALRLQLSSAELAAIGGIGRTLQHLIEIGQRPANTDYLQPLAERGLDVNYLLTGQRSAAVERSATTQHNTAKQGRA